MRTPKISIVIPCYWASNELIKITRNCLESMELELPDEVIVVDDGSPLSMSELLAEMGTILPQTIVVPLEKNQGFPAAVNTGLEVASGDILIISNNDITFTPGWLTGLLKPLQEGYSISSVVTSDQGWETRDEITENDRFGSLWAMKREVYDTLGGLDEQFGTGTFEDADYYLRAKEAGFKIGKNWNTLVEHIGRATFDKVDPNHAIFEENKHKFIAKHGRLI